MFTLVIMSQIFLHLSNPLLTDLRWQGRFSLTVHDFHRSGDESFLGPYDAFTSLPLKAAEVAKLGSTFAPV